MIKYMNKLYFYNTLTRQKEEFKPIEKGRVGLYTCGPTVYNFAHIGNLRTYIFEDLLKRALVYNGYKVRHVMNITDVGHLTGDRDMGEDKLELGAKREGKTAREIAEFYTRAFRDDIKKLNILEPDVWCKATDYIKEQIELIKKLENKGYTYKTSDGIYFNIAKFKNYNKLSHQPMENLLAGARVEINDEKKNAADFALWKFSSQGVKRQMEWPSPWGVGFPGWHIECSAMSLKLLSDELDIHCGGIDHIDIHHTNEIAQSEAATGKKFFNFWLHGAFLNIAGGKKMAKSESNFLTLDNAFIKKGIDPLVFRFACLQTHYRKPMEYSEEAMKNAEKGLKKLYNECEKYLDPKEEETKKYSEQIFRKYQTIFKDAIDDDLNIPQALSVLWQLLDSSENAIVKFAAIYNSFDKIFGLKIAENAAEIKQMRTNIPEDIKEMSEERVKARRNGDWNIADKIRKEIEDKGYKIMDLDNNKYKIWKV